MTGRYVCRQGKGSTSEGMHGNRSHPCTVEGDVYEVSENGLVSYLW